MTFAEGSSSSKPFKSKTTAYVIVCWIFAAWGGLMFGYDIGISGGVTAMDDFLKKFFPKIYERKLLAKEDNYCKYDDQMLQLFTSSLYLAALIASFGASKACTVLGRRPTIRLASIFFIAAALLSGFAPNKFLLIVGRILFGVGVGFGNEAVPLFLSEVAPAHHRGAVNILFQLFITIGILIANLVNFSVANIHPHGWRIALGLAGIPGVFLFFGSLVIMETPTSLIERGYETEGRQSLQKIRGVDDVENELEQIKHACEQAKKVKQPFKKLMKRESVPPLTIAVCVQIFQQFTGINAIMFYAPVLFQTMGFKNDGALLSAVITGIVNVLSTFVSIVSVDKVGRRKLLLQACCQMFICLVGSGVILQIHLKSVGTLDKNLATVVVVLVCLFVMSFAWSWGPMGWLIPSEIFPVETRTAGFAFAVSTNMLFTFIIAQAFLSMLCHMRAGIFFFFAGWVVVMGVFVLFLLPETKGVSIDEMTEKVGSGVILQIHLKSVGTLDKNLATVVVVLVCLFVMSFAWSWGPMGWLIPSEIFPVETRTAGFAFAVSTNMLFTFIIAQAFLSMLCHMRAGIFFFFAGWVVVMGVFVLFLLPETKGVGIDEMRDRVWNVHPVWKRFMPRDGKGAEMI